MVISVKFRSLIAVILLSSSSSFAAEKSEDRNIAPEATPAEAKISFWDLPVLKKAFIDTTPTDRKDDIVLGELGVNGGNKAMLLGFAQELAANNQGDYDSLLITHKNKFIFESYYKRGRINLPHFQSSATKGQTALILGRAIQMGYLTMADLNKPLVSFFKGLNATNFVKGVENITLHHALTMSSGLRFSKEEMTKFRKNPEQFKGIAQIQAYFELSDPITAKSQSYKYQSPDPIMVMNVLETVIPGSAKDFIKNEYFAKLGITNYNWRKDLSGLPGGEGGLKLTSRDMMKLGTLAINKGKWNGEQLLSADYLAMAMSPITKAAEDWQGPQTYFYGYLWYQTTATIKGKSYDIKKTWGGGGNRIILIDELDLVIVLTGHDMKDATIIEQVFNKVIPAFIN